MAAQVPPSSKIRVYSVPRTLLACFLECSYSQAASLTHSRPGLQPLSDSLHRASVLPAVHPCDDGSREDLPLAVHRVQVLQPLRHFRERRACPLSVRLHPFLPNPPRELYTHLKKKKSCFLGINSKTVFLAFGSVNKEQRSLYFDRISILGEQSFV